MDIRKAKLNECQEIADLTFDAFKNYELFEIGDNKNKQNQALYQSVLMNAQVEIEEGNCYVCVDNSDIVASFILIDKMNEKSSMFNWLKAGVWKLPMTKYFNYVLRLKNNVDKAGAYLEQQQKDYFYVDSLVVSPLHQGKKIGSRTLEGINELVKKKNGKTIRLITNSEINKRFYLKNGYTLDDERSFDANGKTITTWSFSYLI